VALGAEDSYRELFFFLQCNKAACPILGPLA